MKWTRDKPTVPDTWWWYREVFMGEWSVSVVRVVPVPLMGDDMRVKFNGSDYDHPRKDLDGEWAGPLSPPEDNEQKSSGAMADREIEACRVCHRAVMMPGDIHPWCIPTPKTEVLWGPARPAGVMRDALSPHQREQALLGFCPYCERPIRGWHLPVEGLPPELYRLIRDDWKIDPRTGHAETCPEKGVTLA